jgi:SagB-type dehydrogenase family enzyme
MNERPKVSTDVVFVPVEDGVLIDGLARREIVRGPLAQTILPDLLRLMDGSRSIEQLIAAFPSLPPEYVRTAVSLLAEWQLVDQEDDMTVEGVNTELLSWFRRYKASLHLAGSVLPLGRGLKQASIILFQPNGTSQAESLQPLLRASGIDRVTVERSTTALGSAVTPDALVVICSNGASDVFCNEFSAFAARKRIRWLHTAFNAECGVADIGPMFNPDEDPCYRCFRLVHGISNTSCPQRPSPDMEWLWISLVAVEIIYALTIPALAVRGRTFRRFHLCDWRSDLLKYPRLPDCADCHNTSRSIESMPRTYKSGLDTAYVFEQYVGLESRLEIPISSPEHRQFVSTILPRRTKRLSVAHDRIPFTPVQLALPARSLDLLAGTGKRTCRRTFPVDDLSVLMAMVGGIRDCAGHSIKRWAATAGNLGSVELFVAVRTVHGLKPGVYFYRPDEHALSAVLKHTTLAVDDFIRHLMGQPVAPLPDILLLLTGAFHKTKLKYGAFGYKLLYLDAGCTLSQLHMIAAGMHINSKPIERWQGDVVEEHLYIAPFREQCTAVIALSRNTIEFGQSERSTNNTLYGDVRRPAHEFCGVGIDTVTEWLFNESRLDAADVELRRRPVPLEFRYPRTPSRAIRLPTPTRGGFSLGDVLAVRRTTRAFSLTPVPITNLSTMLFHATRHDTALWPHMSDAGVLLDYIILAQHVSGVPAGIYEYVPTGHQLLRVACALSRTQLRELFVQPELIDAPVIIWITGYLAAACRYSGSYGHRQLMVRAGAVGHRLWMSALGLGMTGALIAGVIPGAARRLLRIDGYLRVSMCGFCTGFDK